MLLYVFIFTVNVAINKPAYQQYPVRGEERYEAGKAVDGRKSDLSSWGRSVCCIRELQTYRHLVG